MINKNEINLESHQGNNYYNYTVVNWFLDYFMIFRISVEEKV